MRLRGLDGLNSTPFIPFLPLKAGKFTSLGHGPGDRLLSSSRAEPSGRSHGKTAQARMPNYLIRLLEPCVIALTLLFTNIEGR